MIEYEPSRFNLLDVGCGTSPRGDVNVDSFRRGLNPQIGDQVKGDFVYPHKIENFVVADAMHLPFKDASFNAVFSSNTIEHVQNPLLMLQEVCRVARRKVILRYPHVKGSGAVMPYHLNYFDERWFKSAFDSLGFQSTQFVITYDYPVTNKIRRICPVKMQESFLWRSLRHFERNRLNAKFQIPFEMEAWAKKEQNNAEAAEPQFVVVYNSPQVFQSCFGSSAFVSTANVTTYYNLNNLPLPRLYNYFVQDHLREDVWFVFCHQDFVLNEDLFVRLRNKEIQAVYGPIGSRVSSNTLLGSIIQKDETRIGLQLDEDSPVQTLDEMCLIAHAEVFRQGLMFDERFRFHFYGADLCLQAYTLGFDVLAMQLKCQHKSKTIHGDVSSTEYLLSLNCFREKWKKYLPIKTTTALIA